MILYTPCLKAGPVATGKLPDNARQGSPVCGPRHMVRWSHWLYWPVLLRLHPLHVCINLRFCVSIAIVWIPAMAPPDLQGAACCTGNMRKFCELSRISAVIRSSDQYEAIKQKRVCLSSV